jgi:hypothetical protein
MLGVTDFPAAFRSSRGSYEDPVRVRVGEGTGNLANRERGHEEEVFTYELSVRLEISCGSSRDSGGSSAGLFGKRQKRARVFPTSVS